MRKLRVGAWRDDSTGPMQVVSGPVGSEHIHFEGPAAERVSSEMSAFLRWKRPPACMTRGRFIQLNYRSIIAFSQCAETLGKPQARVLAQTRNTGHSFR
jgi:hypothetical protein